eukprot:scaffold242804_cov18-Tisochrysis_lutea.AAC.1
MAWLLYMPQRTMCAFLCYCQQLLEKLAQGWTHRSCGGASPAARSLATAADASIGAAQPMGAGCTGGGCVGVEGAGVSAGGSAIN